MKFKKIEITRERDYGTQKEYFKGKLWFTGNKGDDIFLKVDEKFSKDILLLCFPLLQSVFNEKLQDLIKEIESEE